MKNIVDKTKWTDEERQISMKLHEAHRLLRTLAVDALNGDRTEAYTIFGIAFEGVLTAAQFYDGAIREEYE